MASFAVLKDIRYSSYSASTQPEMFCIFSSNFLDAANRVSIFFKLTSNQQIQLLNHKFEELTVGPIRLCRLPSAQISPSYVADLQSGFVGFVAPKTCLPWCAESHWLFLDGIVDSRLR